MVVHRDIYDFGGTLGDHFQVLVRVKVQMKDDSKPAPQRSRDQAGARRGADQSKSWQLQLDRARRGALSD